jgi:pyruvate-ferredoxin/flavodoxin oxidoreductase
MSKRMVTIDGNEAAAYVAHRTNEICAIYPITPSSNMGEWADQWSSEQRPNIWGTVPRVVELQSEGGASGACHGALQTGALTTTFTASQGLLLMIPNMYKIAGELTSTVFHVSARSIAAQALSIFGDHSDVMAVRQTGWAMIAAGSVQEVMDMALICQAVTLKSRIPVLHFFDGFRTSHEVAKIELLDDEVMRAMLDDEWIFAHRARGLNPDNPVLRGTAQNPDVYFQGRETVNPFYDAFAGHLDEILARFAKLTGRAYKPYEYYGDPAAEDVVVIMGSGQGAVKEAVDKLNREGRKVGVLYVRMFRPFAVELFLKALPATLKRLAVLDRTKEPGGAGEPLYQDVITALQEGLAEGFAPCATMPRVIGGRYGLSSKEFTPAMVKAVFDNLALAKPKNHFTLGIHDDVCHTSLDWDKSWSAENDDVFRAMFYGLGADGTVGANKNSIKIIGEETDNNAQGYFVYDSKKSGSMTISHLRFGKTPIRGSYLVDQADFIGCHQFFFLEKYDVLKAAKPGSTFLLNSSFSPEEVWDHLPRHIQNHLVEKKIRFYVTDAYKVAAATGMGARINTVMQTCFFAISGVLPGDEAIMRIKETVKKTYGAKGDAVVQKNYEAIDGSLAGLHEVKVPSEVTSLITMSPPVTPDAPAFVQETIAKIVAGMGDEVKVSEMPVDGTWPLSSARYEKRNIALEIPEWDPSCCIQCGKCALACPHAAIRIKVYDQGLLQGAPESFKHTPVKGKEWPEGTEYTIQVAPEDCTGCELCVVYCPAKNKSDTSRKALNMISQPPVRKQEAANWEFFFGLPEVDRSLVKVDSIKGSQLLQPLFEFSGACSGCGETPYVKLVSQLYGDRMLVANATGCSSIYGGNLPTTPWSTNADGRGPAWSNSLFEDNAEFGFGFRLTVEKQAEYARELLVRLREVVGAELVTGLLEANQDDEAGIAAQRGRVEALRAKLAGRKDWESLHLNSVAGNLVKRSVWIMGGDGWAYDIGYGGLDHVLASGINVNVMVLDTEVYSNTGGQASKSTPTGAVAKFAAGGKPARKKDLGLMAMSYGNVYVAQVAMGSKDQHTLRAIVEAEAYDGPSLIIAYSHCIAHGISMEKGMEHQDLAVKSGHWLLYRYDPRRAMAGENPLQLDSKDPSIPLEEYTYAETRYRMLSKAQPARAKALLEQGKGEVAERWELYKRLAGQA